MNSPIEERPITPSQEHPTLILYIPRKGERAPYYVEVPITRDLLEMSVTQATTAHFIMEDIVNSLRQFEKQNGITK